MAGKILIVDDDRDITQIIQLLLEGEGYDTAVAGSGEEALERLDGTVEPVSYTHLTLPTILRV